MRLLHLTRDFPPAASGIGDHVARVASEQATQDDVIVVCSEPAIPPAGIEVRTVDWSDRGAIVGACAGSDPDAILWHYNPFQIGSRGMPFPAPAFARSLARVAPLVTIAHELWYPWGRRGLRGLAWSITQRRSFAGVVVSSSSVVLTTVARQRELSRKFPARSSDFFLISAGATVEPSPSSNPSSMRARLGIPERAFVVAHLGAIGEGRDLTHAVAGIEAMRARGHDVRLLLLGRTGVSTPSADFIHVSGPLEHDELSAGLSESDAYLFAEPTGPVSRKTSLLSAMAHGLPVVAYRGPAAEPEFRDGIEVLLVEPSATAIAAALARISEEPDLRRRLSQGARALIEDRYSWGRIAETIRSVARSARREHARR